MAENIYSLACAIETQAELVRMRATTLDKLMLEGAQCDDVNWQYSDLLVNCDVLCKQIRQLLQQERLKIEAYNGTFDV